MQQYHQTFDGIVFYDCPRCLRSYALKNGKTLTYRWLHPISLALYGVLFEKKPNSHAERIANDLRRAYPDHFAHMAQEIELELRQPTQQVRDIIDNPSTEAECRAFLELVVGHLTRPPSDMTAR